MLEGGIGREAHMLPIRPAACHVVPLVSVFCSSTTTLCPCFASCHAAEAPTIPPPTTTVSTDDGGGAPAAAAKGRRGGLAARRRLEKAAALSAEPMSSPDTPRSFDVTRSPVSQRRGSQPMAMLRFRTLSAATTMHRGGGRRPLEILLLLKQITASLCIQITASLYIHKSG